jgi:hypothetical protein
VSPDRQQALAETLRSSAVTAIAPETRALKNHLQAEFGQSLCAILLYGSCLRSGNFLDGLVDLYAVVDNYHDAYRTRLPALFNRLLPPNVFYLEVPFEDTVIRAKYAVISQTQLDLGTSTWFHSYLWGRFAQPCAVLFAYTPEIEAWVYRILAQAVETFAKRTLPCLPEEFSAADFWTQGLSRCYGSELRAEAPERARELFDTYRQYYETLGHIVLEQQPGVVITRDAPQCFMRSPVRTDRARCRLDWGTRRAQGKLLSVLRLTKALYTFRGGVDYIVWKLERHSGQTITVPPRVRRRPLIYGWGFMWRLYRRGLFR